MKNKSTDAQPRYIIAKDIAKNTITVASDSEFNKVSEELEAKQIPLSRVSLTTQISSKLSEAGEHKCECRIRYRQDRQVCTISNKGGVFSVSFDQVQKGLAPGQSVVFYVGNQCLGGAILDA
jgi:tRNA-specific 2-thiouridylase